MTFSAKVSVKHLATRFIPLVSLVALPSADRALGQLSDDDIAALQERAKTEGWTFRVGHNGATRRSLDELCGCVESASPNPDGRPDAIVGGGELPLAFNWCDYGVCTPVRDQDGPYSSHFALNGAFEACINIVEGPDDQLDLSEQWLIDCAAASPRFYLIDGGDTDACGGCGSVSEDDCPYVGEDGPCYCPYDHQYYLETWRTILPVDEPSPEVLKQAIYDYGPIGTLVGVNMSFRSYGGGVFNSCANAFGTLAVVLVGWDDNQGDEGVWILRNSWGPQWGEDPWGNPWGPEQDGGYMRIAYGCCDVGNHSYYLVYNAPPGLVFEHPDGYPTVLNPGEATEFPVTILEVYGATLDPNSPTLHYALNGGPWQEEPLTETSSPDTYEVTLPAASCFDVYDWYVTAEDDRGNEYSDPADAPTVSYTALVATGTANIFIDDFESDRGWEVYAGATTGNWERADPEEVVYYEVVIQPEDDYSPDGTLCYVTDGRAGDGAGDYDVDGGPTILTSPVIDLAGVDPTVSYWRWYHNSGAWGDVLLVEVSNDGGASWVEVESIDDRETWTYVEWKVSDYVTPTDQVRVRFTAADYDDGSLIEALVDDFTITAPVCVLCLGDLDYDDDVDLTDLSLLLANYGTSGGARYEFGDLDLDGDVELNDLSALLAVYGSSCQ